MTKLLVLLLGLFLTLPTLAGSKTYRVVKAAKVNAKVAATIRGDEVLKKPVRISEDGKLVAKKGYTLLKSLSSTGIIVVRAPSDDPVIQKVEVWRKDFGDGTYFVAMCYCPQTADDDCEFSTTASGEPNPNDCGGQDCCTLVNTYVDDEGTRHNL